MMTAIALDDEPLALDIIAHYCNEIENLQLIKTFTQPELALKYLRKFPIDLIFLDINFPQSHGIEIGRLINPKIKIIFTTAHTEHAAESYTLNALDYLVKPFSFDRFLQSIDKCKQKDYQENEKNYFFIRANYQLVKIQFDEILYIEGLADYVKIYLKNEKKFIPRMTMKKMEELLPKNIFIRVHRSFIIPISAIKIVKNKKILLNNISISIGKNYEEIIKNILLESE